MFREAVFDVGANGISDSIQESSAWGDDVRIKTSLVDIGFNLCQSLLFKAILFVLV